MFVFAERSIEGSRQIPSSISRQGEADLGVQEGADAATAAGRSLLRLEGLIAPCALVRMAPEASQQTACRGTTWLFWPMS